MAWTGSRWLPDPEPHPPEPVKARFYQGKEKLELKSFLPFNRTDPASMLVLENKDVVVASDEAEDIMVGKGKEKVFYDSWEDLTEGTDTSTGIDSLEKV